MAENLTGLTGDYRIYQDEKGYRFSQDSVLLANLAEIKNGDRVVDLGAGCGVIGMLLAIKKNPSEVVCVEIDTHASELCRKSAELNGLTDKLQALNRDVRDFGKQEFCGVFDKAVCNPPYFECPPSGAKAEKTYAKFEGEASLDQFISAAARALKFGGDLFIVYKADKLCELLASLRNNKLEPKKLTAIFPKPDRNADTVVISAKKGGKAGLILKRLTVADENGEYTEKVKELYR